jgi:hypothetical protein
MMSSLDHEGLVKEYQDINRENEAGATGGTEKQLKQNIIDFLKLRIDCSEYTEITLTNLIRELLDLTFQTRPRSYVSDIYKEVCGKSATENLTSTKRKQPDETTNVNKSKKMPSQCNNYGTVKITINSTNPAGGFIVPREWDISFEPSIDQLENYLKNLIAELKHDFTSERLMNEILKKSIDDLISLLSDSEDPSDKEILSKLQSFTLRRIAGGSETQNTYTVDAAALQRECLGKIPYMVLKTMKSKHFLTVSKDTIDSPEQQPSMIHTLRMVTSLFNASQHPGKLVKAIFTPTEECILSWEIDSSQFTPSQDIVDIDVSMSSKKDGGSGRQEYLMRETPIPVGSTEIFQPERTGAVQQLIRNEAGLPTLKYKFCSFSSYKGLYITFNLTSGKLEVNYDTQQISGIDTFIAQFNSRLGSISLFAGLTKESEKKLTKKLCIIYAVKLRNLLESTSQDHPLYRYLTSISIIAALQLKSTGDTLYPIDGITFAGLNEKVHGSCTSSGDAALQRFLLNKIQVEVTDGISFDVTKPRFAFVHFYSLSAIEHTSSTALAMTPENVGNLEIQKCLKFISFMMRQIDKDTSEPEYYELKFHARLLTNLPKSLKDLLNAFLILIPKEHRKQVGPYLTRQFFPWITDIINLHESGTMTLVPADLNINFVKNLKQKLPELKKLLDSSMSELLGKSNAMSAIAAATRDSSGMGPIDRSIMSHDLQPEMSIRDINSRSPIGMLGIADFIRNITAVELHFANFDNFMTRLMEFKPIITHAMEDEDIWIETDSDTTRGLAIIYFLFQAEQQVLVYDEQGKPGGGSKGGKRSLKKNNKKSKNHTRKNTKKNKKHTIKQPYSL